MNSREKVMNRSKFLIRFVPLLACLTSLAPVLRAQPCVPPPDGLVSWWRAEGDAVDLRSGNNGTLLGNASFAPGMVGRAFSFDGNRDGVLVGNPTNLQLQDFTIEAWVKRSSASQVSASSMFGQIIGYGSGGYVFGFVNDGHLFLSQNGVSSVTSAGTITDTNWHHVAVTKSGTSVVFFVDAIPEPELTYDVTFAFSTPLVIGAVNSTADASFLGLIDELSIYDRALDASEIQSIFDAGNAGKCPPPPVVISPQGGFYTNVLTISLSTTDTSADIYYTLDGTDPSLNSFLYTDAFTVNETTIVKARSYVFGLPSSQIACEVFRIWKSPSGCVSPPGLVSWWSADCSTTDLLGGNNGTLIGDTSYQAGEVGAAFSFDGVSSAVLVRNAPDLQLQNFTIESWIKRSSATQATLTGGPSGNLFAYGSGGYALGLYHDGRFYLSKAGVSNVGSSIAVTNTDWHHVAVTKSGTNVTFYVDGVADSPVVYSTVFTFTSDASIGGAGGTSATSFYGMIDELGIYNRALSVNEIQALVAAGTAGKCPNYPPALIVPPMDQNVPVGGSAAFSVAASGWQPMSYQWTLNGTNVTDATNATLTITNAQSSNAGNYAVRVSNTFDSVTSTPAKLTVSDPPTITKQPETQTVLAGASANFTVSASGTAPLTYQWRRNGINVPSATSSILIINNVQTQNAGTYTVRISNAVGSIISDPAVLTVASGQFSAVAVVANGIQLTVQGEAGGNYTIDVSSDLSSPNNWQPLVTLLNNPATWQFTDTTTAGVSQRFYRLRKTP